MKNKLLIFFLIFSNIAPASAIDCTPKISYEEIDDVPSTMLTGIPKQVEKIITNDSVKIKKICKNKICKTVKIHKKFNGNKIPKKR